MAKRVEDPFLAPEQFPDLNKGFYTGQLPPHEYLNNRSRALLLAASDSDDVRDAQVEGFQIGAMNATYSDGDFSKETRTNF